MRLSPKYKHSYRGLSLSGAATVPSPVARIPYLRFCCCLIYLLITEAKESESVEVGSTDGDATLLSDVISVCIKPLILIHNLISSAVRCLLSLLSTSLRTVGRLAAEILLLPESFNGYAVCKHTGLRIHSHISRNYF